MIVTIADFTGVYEISVNNYNQVRIQEAIDRYEGYYLKRLLGLTFASAFIADLVDGEPVNPDYLTIFNPLDIQDDFMMWNSQGIKDILLACIYYHYITEKTVQDSMSGAVRSDAEVAKVVTHDNAFRMAEIRWNSMVPSWETVQKYCVDNEATYPDFKGTTIHPKMGGLV